VAKEFRFQDPGEGIHEAEVVRLLVSEGDTVSEGQQVLVVETDKADFEVHAPFGGTVSALHVSEGDMIRVGDDLMTLDGGAAAAEDDQTEAAGDGEDGEAPEAAGQAEGEAPDRPQPAAAGRGRRGKGEGDRKERPERDEGGRASGPVPASPATRRIARELGVELADVPPSGEGGRVLADDVRAFAERDRAPAAEEGDAPARREGEAAAPLPDFSRFGPVERAPLRSVRRTIARRTARAWREIPHVTHHDLADITGLEAFRRRHAAEVEARGGKLTLTVLVLKALAGALSEHPRFNASLDVEAEELVYKRYHHLGVALDSERGLLVPVLRDVDRKSPVELAVELYELAERVRAGEVGRDEMQGGTFTVSNVGPMGGTHFNPIINHPEVAILGRGRASLQPVVRGSLERHEIEPRLLLPLSLGFDHRVNDGADAARFVGRIVELLSDVETFTLGV